MENETKILNLNLEISSLKNHTLNLKKELDISREEILKFKEKERNWKDEMALHKATSKESHASAEVELKNRILSLEGELKKQRERCITIIEEKEDEVNMLKSNMETTLEAAFRAAAKTAATTAISRDSSLSNKGEASYPEESSDIYARETLLQTENRRKLLSASILESAVSNMVPSSGLRKKKSGSVGRDQVCVN